MARIERSIEVRAPPEKIWDVITDFESFSSFMKGVEKIEYLTEKRGLGAKTHWVMETGGNEVEWEAENTEWIENEKAGWRSTSGMKNNGNWLLEPIDTGTKVTLVMDYELPYSVIGKIIDKLKVEKEFTKQVDEGLEAAKKIIEGKALS